MQPSVTVLGAYIRQALNEIWLSQDFEAWVLYPQSQSNGASIC
jgi:hypothetical protein